MLFTALVQTTFSVGYNLYVGLSPMHRPGLLREVLIWAVLTGLAFVIATACIPLIKLAHRLGLMRRVGPTSWALST